MAGIATGSRSSSCSCPPGNLPAGSDHNISFHHPSLLAPTERFPRQLPMALEVPAMSFAALAMPPPVTAQVLPPVPGLLVSCKPAQLHPITYQIAQASIWQGCQGHWWSRGRQCSCPLWCSSPMGCSCPSWLLALPCLWLGTAGGKGDAGAPPADGAGARGNGPWGSPVPHGSAMGAGPSCDPHPAQQHQEATGGLL